ncbi:MAG: hypothetical protein KJ749_12255, partial [Planctomycetes bacterium]|nr:hypothetical protein [Planctomycetota bacterium]
MEEHDHLRGYWPFDELDSLITQVLQDGRIDKDEHRLLHNYFADFADYGGLSLQMPLDDTEATLSGICAVQPEIVFEGRSFLFTGRSERAPRRRLEAKTKELGGEISRTVNQSLDYLVIGAEGNEAWCYSCYGRKLDSLVRTHPIVRRRGPGVAMRI